MTLRFRIVALGLLALASSCRSNSSSPDSRMHIEILGFEGCPNTPIAKANTEAAVAALNLRADVTYIDELSLPNDDLRRGWPAPTILVKGRDLFGMAAPSVARMSCRNYPGGVPSADAIAKALEALIAK